MWAIHYAVAVAAGARSMISSAARCVRGGRLSVAQTLGVTLVCLPKPLLWRTGCGFDLLIDEAFTALRLDPSLHISFNSSIQ